MALEPTDNYIVERNETLYSIEHRLLTTQMEDTDLLAVGRGDQNYHVMWKDIKDDLSGGGSIPDAFPSPDQITATPDFQGGTGTEADPYVLKPITNLSAGTNVQTEELITIDVGGEGLKVVNFELVSGDSGERWEQEPKVTSNVGVWTGRLDYRDIPETTDAQRYHATFLIGTTYFQWTVDQRVVTDIPPDIASATLVETNPDADPRFTDQEFVATINMTAEGLPVANKVIDAFVEGSITTSGQFDEPLESFTNQSGETWSNSLTSITGSFSSPAANAFDGNPNTRAIAGSSSTGADPVITWTLSQEAADLLNTSTGLQWYQVSGDGTPSGSSCAVYRNTIDTPNLLNSAAANYVFPLNLYAATGTINDWVAGDKLIATGYNGQGGGDLLYGILVSVPGDSFWMVDGEPEVKALNFAPGTDMSTLEAGDTVTQPAVGFDEPLESSGSGSTNYGQYLVNLSNPGGFVGDPNNCFDGNPSTGVTSTNNSESIQWSVPEEFQAAGQWMLTVDAANTSFYYQLGLVDGGLIDGNMSSDGSYLLNISSGTNYAVQRILLRSNTSAPTGLREFYHNTGGGWYQIINSDVNTLDFAAGTDMTTLAAGDTVKQVGSNDYAGKLTVDGNWTPTGTPDKAFNGNVTDAGQGAEGNNGTTILTFDCSGNPLGGDIEVYTFGISANPAVIKVYTANSATPEATLSNATGTITGRLFANTTNCTKITVERDLPNLWGISINGVVLLDGATGTVDSIAGTSVSLSESSGDWTDGINVTGPQVQPTGTVGSIDGTSVTLSSGDDQSWTDGVNVTGPQKTITIDNAKRYLKFDSNGNVSDLLVSPQDPQYITDDIGASLTFKFPSTFPSGSTPDEELGDGTTLTVDAYAFNTAGSTGHVQDTVQPEGNSSPDVNLNGLTTLYTGTGQVRSMVTGVDLVNNDGLVWFKVRTNTNPHQLYDTVRGATKVLKSNAQDAEDTFDYALTKFNDNGFDLGIDVGVNASSGQFAAWTFEKAAKYFDVIKHTIFEGAVIPHSLGQKPGMIIGKKLDSSSVWIVYHSSQGYTKYGQLDRNNAFEDANYIWLEEPTDTQFKVGTIGNGDWIFYLFAEDTPGLIKCGSTPSDTSVDLGFEPQWILFKNPDATGSWVIYDSKRGYDTFLSADTSNNEMAGGLTVSGTTFTITSAAHGSGNWVYVAIAKPTTRSLTQEEFNEQALKFATYNNRKHVQCGEQAQADRDALITQMAEAGYDLDDILKYL